MANISLSKNSKEEKENLKFIKIIGIKLQMILLELMIYFSVFVLVETASVESAFKAAFVCILFTRVFLPVIRLPSSNKK